MAFYLLAIGGVGAGNIAGVGGAGVQAAVAMLVCCAIVLFFAAIGQGNAHDSLWEVVQTMLKSCEQ